MRRPRRETKIQSVVEADNRYPNREGLWVANPVTRAKTSNQPSWGEVDRVLRDYVNPKIVVSNLTWLNSF